MAHGVKGCGFIEPPSNDTSIEKGLFELYRHRITTGTCRVEAEARRLGRTRIE